jgi:hypothetical protein
MNNSLQLFTAILSLSIADMEALTQVLPTQIRLRKLEAKKEDAFTEEAESVAALFQLSSGKRVGPTASPIGAGSLIQKFLKEKGNGSRKDVHAYCIGINPNLSNQTIDSMAQTLVKKGVMRKDQGTWRAAA